MNQFKALTILKEALWICITLCVTYIVLYPIDQKIDYTFYWPNFLFVALSILYFRWATTFNDLPFLRHSWVRFALFVFNINIFVYLLSTERNLLSVVDDFYVLSIGFPKVIMYEEVKEQLFKYLQTEVILFGTASLTLNVALQIRIIVSYWQFSSKKLVDMSSEQ